jgi:hypothetical protein
MTPKLHIKRRISQATALLAVLGGLLAATASPAAAFSITTVSGSTGARDPQVPAFPNECGSKGFFSGQFTTTLVWVDRTSDPRYAKSTQYIGAWLTLKKYNGATRTWQPISIDGVTAKLVNWDETNPASAGSPVSTYNTGRVDPITIYNLSPGWYTVEMQYHWFVPGVGYVGYAKDIFNNDTYLRMLGVSIDGSDPSVKSVGSCYVD